MQSGHNYTKSYAIALRFMHFGSPDFGLWLSSGNQTEVNCLKSEKMINPRQFTSSNLFKMYLKNQTFCLLFRHFCVMSEIRTLLFGFQTLTVFINKGGMQVL